MHHQSKVLLLLLPLLPLLGSNSGCQRSAAAHPSSNKAKRAWQHRIPRQSHLLQRAERQL
jgi:hypothetical protein